MATVRVMYAQADITVERPCGAARRSDGPERTCLVTREAALPDQLVRFVVSPDGDVVPDLAGKLPGRGFWLTARRDIVNAACTRNVFARSARRHVSVPDGLADQVEALLARRCLDLVGMARRAGESWSGFEKVRASLPRGRVAVLLLATDAGSGAADKLGAVPADVERIELFDGSELGAVFGRDRTVHGAIAPGRIAGRLMAESRRLAGFRRLPHVGKLN